MTIYIKRGEFLKEIIDSKEQGFLTKKAENMLILLAQKTIQKFSYKNEADMEDCLQNGLLILFQNWKMFDDKITENPFAYYTEVFKRAVAAGYNNIYKRKGDNDNYYQTISLDSCNSGDGIYNI